MRRDDLRLHNTALILRVLWAAEDGAARIDLARQSGLSRATVSTITAELIEHGLVVEGRQRASRGGRPAQILRFHDAWKSVVGIEMGASHFSGVCTDLRGRVLDARRVEFDVQGDPEGALVMLREMVGGLLEGRAQSVLGIGLALPSPMARGASGRLSTDLFPSWAHIDLAGWVREQFGLDAFIDNDANLGALAEHWWGSGRGLSDFAYVKVATGVGAGIIINGDIYRGAGGIAGEVGHTAIDPSGPKCRCGLYGCLEAFVGTQSLLERAAETAETLAVRPAWADEPSLPALISAANDGDTAARELIANAGHWLGIALANLLNLFNPGRVVLGGRLTRAGDLLLEPIQNAVASRALWSSVAETEIRISSLPDEPIALGAATLVLQAALSDPASILLGDATQPNPTLWRKHA